METRIWVWSTCPWRNREVQITEFVRQWILAQWKPLFTRNPITQWGRCIERWSYPASYPAAISSRGRIWKFGQISAGAGAGYDIRCNPTWDYHFLHPNSSRVTLRITATDVKRIGWALEPASALAVTRTAILFCSLLFSCAFDSQTYLSFTLLKYLCTPVTRWLLTGVRYLP